MILETASKGGIKVTKEINLSQAMRAISDQKCCECGKQAKGLVYRGRSAEYYCKKCLHDYLERTEESLQVEGQNISP